MRSDTLNERVKKIKDSEDEINRFVEEYKPFIAACAEKSTGRYVRYGEDDELSIALIAFAEAIRSYDSSKGSFLSFAQNVIRRRLIDYYRKEAKRPSVVSLNAGDNPDDEEKDLGSGKSQEKFFTDEISEYRRLELQELGKELLEWEISFADLVRVSPKHDRTRKICKDIIRFLLLRYDLIELIKYKKHLPVAEIEKELNIPRKNIERVRKYIIASIVIKTGDYDYLRDYIKF